MEPFAAEEKLPELLNLLHMHKFITNEGEAGKIWVLWQDDVFVQVVLCKEQFILLRLEEGMSNILCGFVYAKCNMVKRRELWEQLNDQVVGCEPSIIMGDFNIIRDDSERRGGRPRPRAAMEDFNSWIEHCGLIEMRSLGRRFSWCNGQRGLSRSWGKLDRCFINASGLSNFPDAVCSYLARSTSDHSPMFLEMKKDPFVYGPPPFRFQQMWIEHPDFSSFVEHVWQEEVVGTGLLRLALKLKKLRGALRVWNKQIFSRTEFHLQEIQAQIDSLESALQQVWDPTTEQELLVKYAELANWRSKEETRLAQMAKIKWKKESIVNVPDLTHIISPVITAEESALLCDIPSIDEIKKALDSIPSNSAPGPDGFGAGFFKSAWDIIKMDSMSAVEEFFSGGKWPRFYTSSYVVLIPKMDIPSGFDKFRPKSLCSVFYKICSKIIVNRLTSLLPKMISLEQGAFIPGRSIFENISLTQEMVHSINKKIHGGNVVLKLDMAKAYDRVDWDFLLGVLFAFGFSNSFCSLIRECISTPWYSILMNGTTKGFFKGGRGLRQGDPLSPYLFIILQEILSRLIKQSVEEKRFGQFSQARGTRLISHLMYADDVVIFTNGGRSSIRNILRILDIYESWTGQLINKEKTAMFFSNKISIARKRNLKRLTGFSEGKFPFKYLGIPIVSGKLKIADLEELVRKVQTKISGWKMRLLSVGGRWLAQEPFAEILPVVEQPLLKIKDLKLDHGWDVEFLERVVGREHAEHVINVLERSKVGKDILIWTKTESGNFTTRSAWEGIRAWNGALAVDDNIRRIGIPLASKCNCCKNGQYEDINHVLFEGEVAAGIWKKCGALFGIRGAVLLAFSMNLGYGDSTKAELRALLEGIKRCKELNLAALDIEVDSQVVLSWLKKNRCGIWYLEDYWEELQELIKDMDYKVSHIFREGNAVADWLARWGARVGDAEWRNMSDVPAMLRGLIRMDKWGIASIRCKSHEVRY
ncbi:uncharacterized protein LOC109016147 [Juglans regia]|uniref:Uncharacterized protein LOC109016147 n=1 Tax=Juglans regia TaxID=51240 RepID=A0A6P9E9Z8_JUGRE|nr:uncharacterized protein LOC109016147 [Juglans regia]